MARNEIGEVPNLLQGKSQQAPDLRALGQLEDQVNAISDLTYGCGKRPGSSLDFWIPNPTGALDFSAAQIGKIKFHNYTSGDKNYTVITDGSKIGVIDNEGTLQKMATTPAATTTSEDYINPVLSSGANYSLNAPDSTNGIMKTIADTTFICNTDKVTAMKTTSTKTKLAMSILYVKKITFGRKYRIGTSANNTRFEIELPSTQTVASGDVLLNAVPSARDVLLNLAENLTTLAAAAILDYTVRIIGDNIAIITGLHHSYFTVTDDNNGKDVAFISGAAEKYEDLPYGVPDISTTMSSVEHIPYVRITNSDNETRNDIFLRPIGTAAFVSQALSYKNPDEASYGNAESVTLQYMPIDPDSYWQECSDYSEVTEIDPTTMPIAIKEVSTGVFVVDEVDWGDREAGDSDTNKIPEFIGNTINALGTYQNRLCFLSSNYLVASRTADWFEFFKASVAIDSPDNPCNIAAGGVQSGDSISDLVSMTYIGGDLMVFSGKTQYKISGEFEFTNQTPLVPISPYNADMTLNPVATSRGLMFTYSTGDYTNAKEYLLGGNTRLPIVLDITEHVPNYISGTALELLNSLLFNMAFVRTSTTDIYVYQNSKNVKNEVVQNAWHKWRFLDSVILSMWLYEGALYMVSNERIAEGTAVDGEYTYSYMPAVLSIPLSPEIPDLLGFRPNLDRTVEITKGATEELPKDYGVNVTCILGANSDAPGYIVRTQYDYDTDTLSIADGEYVDEDTDLILGIPYTTEIDPGRLFLRQTNGTPRTLNRTQLRKLFVQYTKSANFTVEVTDLNGTVTEIDYTSASPDSFGIWDQVVLADGIFAVPISSDNESVTIKIVSSGHTPFNITGLKFTARYGKKIRR